MSTHKTNHSETSTQLDFPNLITTDAAARLPKEKIQYYFMEHMNPGQLHFLKLLGFENIVIDKAEGCYYYTRSGKKILDFFGGFGSIACGHNHPRILAARNRFQEEKKHEIAMVFLSQYATALSYNLATIAPGGLNKVFLTNCGSIANEAALKLAERYQGNRRQTIAYATNSFHGKSRAALSVTDSDFYRDGFRLLDNTVRVPFGDADALERTVQENPSIGTYILETIQGGAGIILPPPGYIESVRAICDKYNVIWIADEVQCGYGRTGNFFAFEHFGCTPDIVTLAKSLGGGKTAIGAYITRNEIHDKAYGSPKNALIHGPATFSGMGEGCFTAIESLNILYDEGLIDNANNIGKYLLSKLESLHFKYPKMIKEVRGMGLMIGIEFLDISQTMPIGTRSIFSIFDEKLKGSICGFIGSLLLHNYNILVGFTEYNRNVIRLEPPLVTKKSDVDLFISAIDDILSKGIHGIIGSFAKTKTRKTKHDDNENSSV
jgi:acetylornithine/succinyldiaminopimelate/putrescine aminotransferase